MGDLAEQRRTVLVDPRGELLEIGQHAIVADVDLRERQRRIDSHRRRTAENGEPEAALRLLRVIELIALPGHAVLGIVRGVRRAHDAVAQQQVLQLERLQ